MKTLEPTNRYHRHHVLPNFGEKAQKRLAGSAVLIIGAGGLGSPSAMYLTAAGIGRIGLADNDTVSLTNLHRQILYKEKEIGQVKIECAQKVLNKMNSEVEIQLFAGRFTTDTALEWIRQYDVVIDACDNFETRYLINDACVAGNIPHVYGAINEYNGQVSVFNYQEGATYRCLYPNEEELCMLPSQPRGVLGVLPGIVGCWQANETIKILTGIGQVLQNRLLLIDTWNAENTIVKIAPLPQSKAIAMQRWK